MPNRAKNSAVMVASFSDGATCSELERDAAAGKRPRKDYLELARALDADVIDSEYMVERAANTSKLLASRAHPQAGRVAEAFVHGRHQHIIAWGDALGLSMAFLLKMARSGRNLSVVAYNASGSRQAALLKHLKVHTHVHAFFYQSSVQIEFAGTELGVPRHKLHRVFQPVDERFWEPTSSPTENIICTAGVHTRDYATLLHAIRDMPVALELALASTALVGSAALEACGLDKQTLFKNAQVTSPSLLELRALYAKSRFVVLPLSEASHDAGATVVAEAMSMGKAVILTRNAGQRDIIRDKEHGLYVPPRDPAALREAIRYLLDHPEEAERMGRAGRALVEARYTLDSYVSGLARVVRGLEASIAASALDAPRDLRTGTKEAEVMTGAALTALGCGPRGDWRLLASADARGER